MKRERLQKQAQSYHSLRIFGLFCVAGKTKHFKHHKNMWGCEETCQLYDITQKTTKPAKTEAVGLNIAGSWLVKYLVKLGSDCFGTISAVCVVSLHVWNIITRHFNTAHNKHEQAKTMAPSKTLQKKESQPVWSHQDIHESIQHSWHSIDHGKRARHWTTWSTWGKQGG